MGAVVYGATLVIAFALGAALVRGSISLSHKARVYDSPDGVRKFQTAPIPRLGGVAVALGFLILVLLGFIYFGDSRQFAPILGIGLPALAMALVGLADDYRQLAPWPRMAMQAGVALAAVLLGTSIELTGNSLVDAALTILWIVAIVNGVNLLDNSDGLAASTVLVSSIGIIAVAFLSGQQLISLLAIALMGLCLGFLVFNWFPARVYLGDSGAYFLGFLLAVLTIRLRPAGIAFPWTAAIPLLLAALPLVDTSWVVVRRLSQGIHPFQPGRDHLSHSLQSRGLSIPGSVILLQVALAATCAVAVAIALRV